VECVLCGSDKLRCVATVDGFDVARCDHCGLRFVPPVELSQVNYDEYYQDQGLYDFSARQAAAIRAGSPLPLRRARRAVIERIERDRAGSVLEVGCGVGAFLYELQQRGIACWGVEPSGNAVAMARDYLNCPVHHGYLDESVFPGRQFEAVCSWEVVEHVSDVRSFLANLVDRLLPGGALYLSTPNYGSRWMWADVPRDPRSAPPVHVTFWDSASLTRLLEQSGLVHIEVQPTSYPVNPGIRSRKLLGKYRATLEALLWPKQRASLYVRAEKPR
jgi:SAM-dependent methyltransferase